MKTVTAEHPSVVVGVPVLPGSTESPQANCLSAGQVNEGIESTLLGLKGIPKLAEELIVERDINILKYTGGKVHFAHISSPKSLDLIREAKKQGLQVSCDIG